MNIKIGAVIKNIRAKSNITQEALAAALCVTPQAISRWESEGGYPDIELLPALADFFSVSIDELLGYNLSQREEELANIKKEMARLAEDGTIEERVTFARNVISRYPLDFEIKENLAVCLYHLWQDTDNDTLIGEIENLCKSVIAECDDEDIRCDAIHLLISMYGATKECDKAMEAVNLLTPLKNYRELAKAYGIGDGNAELYIQDEIDKLTDCLGTSITSYVLNGEVSNAPSTWDRKIEMLHISNQLYKMIYGDHLMFYHCRLSHNYWLISTYQISQGKTEEALDSLNKSGAGLCQMLSRKTFDTALYAFAVCIRDLSLSQSYAPPGPGVVCLPQSADPTVSNSSDGRHARRPSGRKGR